MSMDDNTTDTFTVEEPLMIISIAITAKEGRPIYDAVRHAWKINPDRARDYKLVLARDGAKVVGAFRPHEWLEATRENFPEWDDSPGRYGFVGEPAESAVWEHYVGKRIPDRYRPRGAANPVRYCRPDDQMLTPESIEAAHKFIEESSRAFDAGDTCLGSQKLWDAASSVMAAAARQRGWPHETPDDLGEAAERLGQRLGYGPDPGAEFEAAEVFLENVQGNFMKPREIYYARKDVEIFIEHLQGLVE